RGTQVPGRNRPEQLVAGSFVDAGTTRVGAV
ncbi:MAG: hypothetical protein QOJ07_2032, partial [Thermoleophilaceae bacterium]|nr:hypothetical protein [Thermoleophilaceae bacterium]